MYGNNSSGGNWSMLRIDNIFDDQQQNITEIDEKSTNQNKDIISQIRLNKIHDYIDNIVENYIISLHYIDIGIIICYGKKVQPNNELKLSLIQEPIEYSKEIYKILLQEQYEFMKGFHFIKKQVNLSKDILESGDQETFDKKCSNSGLDTWTINNLKTIWKNKRFEYLTSCIHKSYTNLLYKPNLNHPICEIFKNFLKQTYFNGVDRFKAFICIGSSYIGKSVFFTKFICNEKFIDYHSNILEYSQMSNQPMKIFRILDDINWSTIPTTEFKALLNRNVSSVNVKYGYEYVFPLIPIILMNKEDYETFRENFKNIWKFIEKNVEIYPKQINDKVIEETEKLYTNDIIDEKDNDKIPYLFDSIVENSILEEQFNKKLTNNMNLFIKNYLNENEGYYYDSRKYLTFPGDELIKNEKLLLKLKKLKQLKRKDKKIINEEINEEEIKNQIPNPILYEHDFNEDYKQYCLMKKKEEMEKYFEKKRKEEQESKIKGKKEYKRKYCDDYYYDDDEEEEENDEYKDYYKKKSKPLTIERNEDEVFYFDSDSDSDDSKENKRERDKSIIKDTQKLNNSNNSENDMSNSDMSNSDDSFEFLSDDYDFINNSNNNSNNSKGYSTEGEKVVKELEELEKLSH